MSDRHAPPRLGAFFLMTATLVVALYVLARLGPGAPAIPITAHLPGPSADRYDPERMQRLLAMREITTQMLGAAVAPPYTEAEHRLPVEPAAAPPPRNLDAPVPDPRPIPLNTFRPTGPAEPRGVEPRGPAPGADRENVRLPRQGETAGDRTTSAGGGPRRYHVRRGDNLATIAERELGARRFARHILDANPHLARTGLEEDMVIDLPPRPAARLD